MLSARLSCIGEARVLLGGGAELLKARREGRAGAEARGDAQIPAVAVHDVLDDGEAEPGAAFLAARGGIDPIEALGEPRQVLRRDPRPVVGDARVWVTVADDGPGIGPEHLPRLTERFYRVNAASSREKGGTGLGLAIVKHIMNRHRGELRIASRLGAGSTFTASFEKLGTSA